MATVDWIVVGVVAFAALIGFRRGLVTSVLSTAGIVVGAIVGARLAPHFLPDGARSPYTPLVALAGAVMLAGLLQGVGSLVGSTVRRSISFTPLRAVDSAGGLLAGALAGLAVVWVVGAVALHLPGQRELRRNVQASEVLRTLYATFPPRDVLRALARVDPLPLIVGPAAPAAPPDPRVLAEVGPRVARSVVRITGTACGLGVVGSGWVARPQTVVTAAHVVAGQDETTVEPPGARRLDAQVIAFDPRNDVAVLRVPGLQAAPLPLRDPSIGTSVAILGYPGGGELTARAGRIGRTAAVVTKNAYGEGPVSRTITSIAGDIRQGNSGGPAVDASGAVRATVFAARADNGGGFGVPDDPVRVALEGARGPVSTGDCAG